MKNCALCLSEFIQENVGRCSPQLLDLCTKYLHSSLTQKAISNQSKSFASFCPKCFQSTAELVDLNSQMEFHQKRINDLVLNISLGILCRRGKSANAIAKSSGEKLIEFDVSSALPNYESKDVSTSYCKVNASSAKEFDNNVFENNYSYPDENMSDPLLTTPSFTGCENVINVKVEHSSEMFVEDTQIIEEQFEENESRPIYIESSHYNFLNGTEYAGVSPGGNLESGQIFPLSSESEATNSIPKVPYTIVSAVGSRRRQTKRIATRVHNRNIDLDPEKSYECQVCYKRLTKPHHLTVHMRIHTGERPFICAICKKAFTTKPNLVAHERIHTGEKPFSCDLCLKRFNNESNLIHHKKRHATEKTFRCNECDYSSNNKHNFERHEKTHVA